MRRELRKNVIENTAKALSDLNMFYAIIALCESSLFSPDAFRAEQRIVSICRSEAQKCLKRYDDGRFLLKEGDGK